MAVESQDVFLGETFTFQIIVSGKEQPTEPDLAAATQDFEVEYASYDPWLPLSFLNFMEAAPLAASVNVTLVELA